MRNKEYLTKTYRHFSDFVAASASRELEYLIMDAKYTTGFSLMMKHMLDDVKESGFDVAELSVLFNTNGEIAVIAAEIVGRYVADRYCVVMEAFYKNASLNKIAKSVIGGNEKVKLDFLKLSYSVLYETINELYMEIKCRKDLLNNYKEKYNILDYHKEDVCVALLALVILEDICKYMEIDAGFLVKIVEDKLA